ncbi:FAD-dependent oxidoreductase [Desulfovibrio sp. OttesenSCG-928-F07]|nr:FAD-dependent oxidoreductase [Desulfovibrio sp. OttesenSCG-928-F07]
MHVVVIGAVALGPKAASRFKRLMPDAKVTMIDQASRISYGGCGIPFYISGEINRIEELQATPYGIIRDADFFKSNKGIDVLVNTRATAIDRKAKTVTIEDLVSKKVSTLSYDKLVLGLGSSPNRPPIPGIELEGISACTNLDEAEYIKTSVQASKVNNAVVVGGGFIGLEVAVALADMWGIPTSVVEVAPHILPTTLSPTMAAMATKDLEEHDVAVFAGEKVLRFEGENGKVSKVVTDKREIKADLVIMSAGVRPNTDIARDAGIAVTDRGMIIVDEQMRTSDPDVFSGGDCAVIRNLVTGGQGWFALGSMSNRQGRVIGTNLAGGTARFPGAVGSWAIKLFEQNAAGAGLTLAAALREGYDAVNVHVEQVNRAHYYPGRAMVALDLVVDKPSRRVLGIQGSSADGDGLLARINPVAVLLQHKPTIEDISNLEVAYSPPFSSAMDVINVAGNVADNLLAGRIKPMTLDEFKAAWDARNPDNLYVIDARVNRSAQPIMDKFPEYWHNIPTDEVRKRIAEVPKDRQVVLICNTGLRSYEAQLIMTELGVNNTVSVYGGMSGVGRLGLDIAPKG